MVLEKLESSYLDEYNKLDPYAQELRDSNPGSDVVIQISKVALEEGKRRFLRMYVCFQALKNGFKAGLSPFIGLDGTFLKGKCQGMLQSSLDLKEGEGVTFISDIQKIWHSDEMKKLLWWSAWSTYEEEFKDMLRRLGEVFEDYVKDLLKYPSSSWCRAYLDTQYKNPMVDNNFTESFNSWIRQQPIVKMLETIRVKVMTLLKDHENEVSSWKDDYIPYTMELYNDYKEIAQDCTTFFNREGGYEVSQGSDRHIVILELQTCTSRIWDFF
ncbi:uncharacterized protein LOC142182250 [Nicotiana tabacum]|uniref:Uncharacterized protein LOC142182250 n=1 Tax=Nicotiana tabacum TaxID=4097 RepID=A0AC58USN1_TOBAC